MVYIEKLQSSMEYPHLTLVDLVCNNNTQGRNYLEIYPASHLLKQHVDNDLNDIKLGQMYGAAGIHINDLLTTVRDLIVETTYHDLLTLPKAKQIKLLTNYTVILTDIEEGGAFLGYMGPCLLEHIRTLNVIPKQIYSLNAGIYQNDYPELNITSCFISSWTVLAMLNDQYFIDLIFDNAKKQQAIDIISKKEKLFGLCLNKKPRYNRVKLLAELDKRNLLELFDWTLLYSSEPLGTDQDFGSFLKSPNNFRFNNELETSGDQAILTFLKKHSLPKLMPDAKQNTFGDSIGASPEWVGKYQYYVSNETYCNQIPTSLGFVGFITEKTFKAMSIGAYPFVVGVPDSEKKLKQLGFKINDHGYDHLQGAERILAVCDVVENAFANPTTTHDLVLHNFELITNLNFLVGLITNPIKEIVSLHRQQS